MSDETNGEHTSVIVPGSVCPKCGSVAEVTNTTLTLPHGKPHPKPYRRFRCRCGERWKLPIPSNCLLRVANNPA